MPVWERLTYELPAAEEEALSLEIWARGAVGVEILADPAEGERRRRIRLLAYFEGEGLECDPASWKRRGIRRLERAAVEERDWLAGYRAAARPFDVGRRLRIDPSEPPSPGEPLAPDELAAEAEPAPDRTVLRIPARRAFGTGTHESTRLLLEWLEETELEGRRLVDVGTGSGILAFAAARFGSPAPVGVDLDPEAVFLARENARANRIVLHLVVGTASCLAPRAFEIALLNILPYRWLDGLETLGRCLVEGGLALISGASREDVGELRQRLGERGWRVRQERVDGEWRALAVEAPGSGPSSGGSRGGGPA